MMDLTLAGTVHTALASVSILVGAVQFLRPKGGPIHRALGYLYVYAMIVGDGAALLVYEFTGKFNVLHIGAIVSIICIALGVWPALRAPRHPDWRSAHYVWMSWSYVGLLAAAATELVVRNMVFSNRIYIWSATLGTTAAITIIGYAIIARNRQTLATRSSAGRLGLTAGTATDIGS